MASRNEAASLSLCLLAEVMPRSLSWVNEYIANCQGQDPLTFNTASLRFVASARASSTGPEASLAAPLTREERVKAWLPDK